jgi:predicted Zn-dependent peptidase
MGVSHFLEHMMFKGTHALSAEDINRGYDAMGARNNAYTTSEMTCFYAHVLPERLDEAVELTGAMMRPALRQADFDTEKKVILEEIAMYRDNPFWVLYEEAVARRYPEHGLGHRVLGTAQTVGDMPRDAMAAYFADRYSADNTVVSLAGRVDFDAQVRRIESLCGLWARGRPGRSAARPRVGAERFELRDPKVSRGYVVMLAAAPGATDEDRYAASALAYILGGSDNARLHWALIETGLAEEASASFDGHDGTGDYFIFASGDPDSLDQIESVLREQMAALVASLDARDLERLRNRLATSAAVAGERPEGRMQRLGRQWTTLGRYTPLEDEIARINALTIDDLRRVGLSWPISAELTGRMLPAT